LALGYKLSIPVQPLTKLQRKIRAEITQVLEYLDLEPDTIVESYTGDQLTWKLRMIRDHVIRGEVITCYLMIDVMLEAVLRVYYFKRGKGSVRNLRKSKRVSNFNALCEELFLMQKFRQVKRLIKVPKSINVTVERINVLRNSMAHSFYSKGKHSSKYKGKDIFSFEGLKSFREDAEEVFRYFNPRIFELSDIDDSNGAQQDAAANP